MNGCELVDAYTLPVKQLGDYPQVQSFWSALPEKRSVEELLSVFPTTPA